MLNNQKQEIMEILRSKKVGSGHFQISMEMNGKQLTALTTNTMAIDAAFDDCYDDEDNSGRIYESQEEAQQALIDEILKANDIQS